MTPDVYRFGYRDSMVLTKRLRNSNVHDPLSAVYLGSVRQTGMSVSSIYLERCHTCDVILSRNFVAQLFGSTRLQYATVGPHVAHCNFVA